MHGTLRVVACGDTAKVHAFVAGTVILAGDNEVLKLGIADEHKAFCRDQRLQPGTGIGPEIDPAAKPDEAKIIEIATTKVRYFKAEG